MKTTVSRRVFLGECMAFAAVGCSATKGVRQSATVSDELRRQIAEGLMAGCVCGLVGGPLYAAGERTRHPVSTPMTEDCIFDLASVGKTFTASLCARLAAEGRLDPDAPFTKYLPEHVLAKENCAITVRDLATHTGGFDNSKPYILPDPAAFDRALFAKRPVRARDVAYEYACSNFIYLGKIVEHLTGTDLETAARTLLWNPLGMRDTCWHEIVGNPRAVETFANGHLPPGMHGDESTRVYPWALGNGSAFSTAGDMLKFADDLLTRRTFPKTYYDLLSTPCWEKDGKRRSFGWDMSAGLHRPFGWSAATIAHGGFTGNTIAVDPERGFAGVVLTSRTGDRLKAYAGHGRLLSLMSGSRPVDALGVQ